LIIFHPHLTSPFKGEEKLVKPFKGEEKLVKPFKKKKSTKEFL
jgi:hypothetical protein